MTASIDRLLTIMARLREPQRGCPWDREQDFASIAPYTIEEAYEVADAIERGDMAALKDELGDLLFQVVFHARMAEEAGTFAFADVVAAISEKMERRHPHVFGEARIASAAAQTEAWEAHKAAERAARGGAVSALDGVALAYPALLRAAKIGRRAARIGFDWPDATGVFAKLAEETAELRAELDGGAGRERIEDEIGDLLFAAAQLARKLDIEPETALRRATAKFERRFRRVETLAAERAVGRDLDALEALWREVKQRALPALKDETSPEPTLRLERATTVLPSGLTELRTAARAEGHFMLETLAADWASGKTRFDKPGEALFFAYAGARLAGIGGVTEDPSIVGALRMRRFYVCREYRRHGIARALAAALLDRPEARTRAITANAAAGSEAFWEALGFVPDRRDGCTHRLRR